jgi:predicted RNase H-like HicB family nuclease
VVAVNVYQVRAQRTGDWWALEVPELPGVFGQAKRLDKADAAACDAIAAMLDVDPGDVQVSVHPVLPDDVTAVVEEAQETRRAAERAPLVNKQAARVLTGDLGLSLRDAGVILGLSFQRVAQLLGPGPRKSGGDQGGKPRRRLHA